MASPRYTAPFRLVLLALSLLAASCSSTSEKIDPNILTTAWLTCESAMGTPNGGLFSGKAVLVWNLHDKMDYHKDDSIIHTERIGNQRLTDSRYFILGNYSDTQYYSDKYDVESLFTRTFDSAGAFLCVFVSYTDVETCTYGSNPNAPAFTVIRTVPEAEIKLVSWPDKQIIAETHAVAGLPDACSPMMYDTSNFSTDHLVVMNNIDILEWLLKYRK